MNKRKQLRTKRSLYERYINMNRAEQKAFREFCKEQIDVSPKTIYNWISGASAPDTLKQIAVASFLKTIPSNRWFTSKASK